MKEELISFETAKLAKEKGFEVNNTESHFFYKEGYAHPLEFEYLRTGYGDDIIAPTQSLLQKWLREKYSLHIQIDQFATHWDYYFDGRTNDHPTFEGYKTYEEALEAGLVEALKLIK